MNSHATLTMEFLFKQIAPPQSWDGFAELCQALFQALWQDAAVRRCGGQAGPQSGVDLFGHNHAGGGGLSGVLCMAGERLSGKALRKEQVAAELAKADQFQPPLKHWIIATSDNGSADMQDYVRGLAQERASRGLFPVNVLAWGAIHALLANNLEVAKRFYPEHFDGAGDVAAPADATAPAPAMLSRIVLHGFKSIQDCDLELRRMNVLIGPNGAGKSNFIAFFRMLQHMLDGKLQLFVGRHGGPDALLHFGRRKTAKLAAALHFGDQGYRFELEPTIDNRLMIASEQFWTGESEAKRAGAGNFESLVMEAGQLAAQLPTFGANMAAHIRRWRLYHFHDTSDSALVKQLHAIGDNIYLRPDARNLAAFLYMLKGQHPLHYQLIVKTVRLVAPYFGDFFLRPYRDNPDMIELEWMEKGEDLPFKAHHLSDGTLRFICLATVLLQPDELLPEIIFIDEPELGLHPYAVHLLASMLQAVAEERQLVVSTQSTEFLDEFEPEDVIVADRTEHGSWLHRLDVGALAEWLEEYSLAELWKKNILGGRPGL